MLRVFQRYPGCTLGTMAAVGAVKVGGILWQTTLSAWPLLHVLMLPLIGGGLALGVGLGYDHLVAAPTARRLGIAGLVVSVAVAGWPFVGPVPPTIAWMGLVPVGPALLGIALGRRLLPTIVSERPSSQQRMHSG
ncbi:MAG: hypothetical protein BRD41_07065 [Bacteroidetes bacterium QS_1_63_11]|nr:MAG: hypothetical protein BRD41_07065 [Bacteroidetes bacterium QS_1_63_11]